MKIKIQIRSFWGTVLFEAEKENYTVKRALQDAVLRGADLRGAVLRGIKGDLPQAYVNEASREMLFIFEHLKSELPYLREKLVAGEVDGTQYEGDCACLIGSLGQGTSEGVDQVCEAIPYYEKGLHNISEQWFWNIREGDTPESSPFAKQALKLIDDVLALKEPA
jgi:hypothetical protein